MSEDLNNRAGIILRDYRHLMNEAERRADRAFYFQERLRAAQDPAASKELTASLDQALADRAAAELFAKGRTQFLSDLVRRIVHQHAKVLPRCANCGAVLKMPNPRLCFNCEDQWPPDDGTQH